MQTTPTIDPPTSRDRSRVPQQWRIWIACALLAVASQTDPPLWILEASTPVEPFNAVFARYWRFTSTSILFLLLFLLGGGVLGDLFGRRRTLLIGATIFTLAAGANLFPLGLGWTILSVALLGLGSALAVPLALANIRLAFGPRELRLAVALYATIGGLASILVATTAPIIKANFGWRATYLPTFLWGCVALWACWRQLPESRAEGSYARADAIGISAWALVILPVTYAIIRIGVVGFTDPSILASLGAATVGALIVLWRERRVPSLLRRSLPYPVRIVAIIMLTGMMLNFALLGYAVQLFYFFRAVLAYGPVLAALALAPCLIGVALGLVATRLGKGRRPGIVIGTGLIAMVTALVGTSIAVLLFRAVTPYWLLAPLMIMLVAGYIVASTAWISAYLSAVPVGLIGVGAAISSGANRLGSVLASTLLGTLIVVFGQRDFENRLRNLGLSPEQIELALAALVLALQPAAVTDPAGAQAALVGGYRESYAIAFGAVLLVIAVLLAACTLIVWFGLRTLLPVAGTAENTLTLPVSENPA